MWILFVVAILACLLIGGYAAYTVYKLKKVVDANLAMQSDTSIEVRKARVAVGVLNKRVNTITDMIVESAPEEWMKDGGSDKMFNSPDDWPKDDVSEDIFMTEPKAAVKNAGGAFGLPGLASIMMNTVMSSLTKNIPAKQADVDVPPPLPVPTQTRPQVEEMPSEQNNEDSAAPDVE